MPPRQRPRRGLAHWIISAQTPIFVVDSRRVVLVFNQGCEQLTGWPAAEVIGQSCAFSPPESATSVASITSALVPPEKAFREPVLSVERSLPHKDGSLILRSVQFLPLQESNEPAGMRVMGILIPVQPPAAVPAEGADFWHAQLLKTLSEMRRRYQLDSLIAKTPQMHRVLSQLQLASQSTVAVHFEDAAGVGKEHLARCLHAARSATARQPFVPLDCASLTHFELHRALQRAYDPDHTTAQPAGGLF